MEDKTMQEKNFYRVVAKCGHVGRCNYILIAFAVMAENGKEAARMTRLFPRVKHDHKDAILECVKISYEEYLELQEVNNNDPYLKCKSKHQQNETCNLADRLVEDLHNAKLRFKADREGRIKRNIIRNKIQKVMAEVEIYEYAY
jgi:hypothetical protein